MIEKKKIYRLERYGVLEEALQGAREESSSGKVRARAVRVG